MYQLYMRGAIRNQREGKVFYDGIYAKTMAMNGFLHHAAKGQSIKKRVITIHGSGRHASNRPSNQSTNQNLLLKCVRLVHLVPDFKHLKFFIMIFQKLNAMLAYRNLGLLYARVQGRAASFFNRKRMTIKDCNYIKAPIPCFNRPLHPIYHVVQRAYIASTCLIPAQLMH